jgi:lactoylglutathione lyase
MNLRYTHTRLMVADVARSVDFYRDVLGFEPAFDPMDSVYVEFLTGEHRLSLYKRELMDEVLGNATPPESYAPQDRVLLSMAVDNVDEVYEAMKARGVQFVVPPTDRPVWALRTAHFRDPDGHIIEINHDIPQGT